MIVSHRHQYVFLAVPHTASTAIGDELVEHYDGERVLAKHAWLHELERVDPRVRDYRVFCTTRHPLDLVCSVYYRLRSNHEGRFDRTNPFGVDPRRIERASAIQDEGLDLGAYLRRFHQHTYVDWMLSASAPRADLVLRFESVRDDFARMLAMLEVPSVRPLPVRNATAKPGPAPWHDLGPDDRRHAATVFGPFLRDWCYELPPAWEPVRSRRHDAEYRLVSLGVRAAAAAGLDHRRCVRVTTPLRLITH